MPTDFFNLGNPAALRWLWLLVPLAVLFGLDLHRRARVLRVFVERSLLDDVAPRRSVARPIVRFVLGSLGLAALVFGLARPRWDPQQIELEQRGQNILFCLDVSNSMRARDVDPSRLEAAKSAVRSLLEQLPAGHQVGLMAYAGEAELKCPLTPNYRHVLSVLDRVTFNSVDFGGTNLGDAIHQATHEVFGLKVRPVKPAGDKDDDGAATTQPADPTIIRAEQPEEERSANVLIILTDGESHEGHATEMAREAHALGVGVYIIGLGTAAGAPIPIEMDGQVTHLKYKGEEVITRFDDASLRAVIAGLPDRCGYLAAGSANIDLADVYNEKIAKQTATTRKLSQVVWDEKFQLFVGLGLVMVAAASLISEQRPAGRNEQRGGT